MSLFADVVTAIRTRLATAPDEGVPIAYDSRVPLETATQWFRFTVEFASGDQETTTGTGGIHSAAGVAFAQVFAPLDSGDATILAGADAVADVMRGWANADPQIVCGTPLLGPLIQSGPWASRTVRIPFTAYASLTNAT